MNPIMNMLNMNMGTNGAQGRNMMAMAMSAMMSGKSPQEFLKSIPELKDMDFSNIQQAAKKVCNDRGVNYEDAKNLISSQIGMK